MLKKTMNHVIQEKKSKINTRKRIRSQGCGQYLESYIHTPKPQIQDVEPRRRRVGIRKIPCVFSEERKIKKLLCVLCFLGEKYGEKREKNA